MSAKTTEMLDWEPLNPPTDIIFDDGEPLETNRHRIAMNTLIDRSNKHGAICLTAILSLHATTSSMGAICSEAIATSVRLLCSCLPV
jgi:hypothetical protein